MKTDWKKKSTTDKTKLILGTIASIGIVLLGALRLFGVLRQQTMYLAAPLASVVLLLHSIQDWKKHRVLAIFEVFVAIFIFGCSVAWFLN